MSLTYDDLLNKSVFAQINYCHGKKINGIREFIGTVNCSNKNIISVKETNGETFYFPADLSIFSPAESGSYTVEETGEKIVDPDFTASMTVQRKEKTTIGSKFNSLKKKLSKLHSANKSLADYDSYIAELDIKEILERDDTSNVINDAYMYYMHKFGWEHTDKYNPVIQTFITVNMFLVQINNGGLIQFFENSSSNDSEKFAVALSNIGADKAEKVLRDCFALFPESEVPEEAEVRMEMIDIITYAEFEKYDDTLYEMIPYIKRRLLAFMKEFKEEFILEYSMI